MARNAVHAALAGNTGMLIGRWHGRFVHVPMALATRARKVVEPHGDLWMSVIEATGQPVAFGVPPTLSVPASGAAAVAGLPSGSPAHTHS
jgi:hypothetical protein